MYQFTVLHIIFVFAWMHHGMINANTINVDKININLSWKSLEFYYPNEEARQQAINEGLYNPGAAIPIDVDGHYDQKHGTRIFITTPRFVAGVPATVGYLSNESSSADGSYYIKPYPNLKSNTLDGNCNHITSVYRIKVDECNRLWVLDTGKLLEKFICPPQILVFDLTNDQLISRYRFDNNELLGDTQFITPVVDIRHHKCSDTFVYIADVERYQLYVYDYKNNKSWGIRNKNFYPNPEHGTFTINNLSFDLMDGLFGMALGPIMPNGDRILYFHALASVNEKFVYTSTIRNSTLLENNSGGNADLFGEYPYKRPSQSASEAMSKNGVLFYGSLSENAIKCWNSLNNYELNDQNIQTVLKDNTNIEFTAGVKISESAVGREILLVNSIPYQRMANNLLNTNEINFRIFGGFVDELISGTKCAPDFQHQHHHNHYRYSR